MEPAKITTALLQYFSSVPLEEVPIPEDPLSSAVPPVAIRAANAGVQRHHTFSMHGRKKLSAAEIGKYASEIGVVAAARHSDSRELSKPLVRSEASRRRMYRSSLEKKEAEDDLHADYEKGVAIFAGAITTLINDKLQAVDTRLTYIGPTRRPRDIAKV